MDDPVGAKFIIDNLVETICSYNKVCPWALLKENSNRIDRVKFIKCWTNGTVNEQRKRCAFNKFGKKQLDLLPCLKAEE